ncbi:TetR/AcrR family transcriptional regulator [Amycolatopsis sp., V23-08]|uniref:TetR/AcrR family transcriptional regulator n=1 Tax=Amycolatopsis heterodermiae TaxID=3110235 RepID=A0ABU5R409_9PSEU|nr:TetR/AcrR family transcriptional regulator [Amycolatopsis sp., V23-08]MEA5360569.1 TetR/AcrR family transcriptional regulator [Amycolatopsis sp., V23-08]
MPTGVHIRDARRQLFDAAERVLLRDGPSALTSRSVTTEADCAKGVLHRHFADFDEFLAELVQERITRVGDQAAALRAAAGTGTVQGNLAAALTDVLDPTALAMVSLVFFRDEVRTRLRGAGVPVLAEAREMLAAYLVEERALGRIAADADVDNVALSLIGAGHLLFAGRRGGPPPAEEVDQLVATVIADVVQRRLL